MEASAKEDLLRRSSSFGEKKSEYDCTITSDVTRCREGQTDSKPLVNALTFFCHKFSEDCILAAVLQ